MKIALAVCLVSCSFAAASGVGCSSSTSGGGGRSGVTESKSLNSLTDSDKRSLCDWVAGQLGGYGHKQTQTCTINGQSVTVSRSAPTDQTTCVNELNIPASCTATVSQAEDCEIANAGQTDLCAAATSGPPAVCAPLESAACTGHTQADAGPSADSGTD
jgi:hypothetical protein